MKRITILTALLIASSLWGEIATKPTSGSKEYNDPLKVKGQTRRLNMLLNLKSDAEIKFVKLRKNYRSEILATQY